MDTQCALCVVPAVTKALLMRGEDVVVVVVVRVVRVVRVVVVVVGSCSPRYAKTG